jgi:hypothetical protein
MNFKVCRKDEGGEGPCRREKRTGGRDEIGGGVAGLFSTERGGIDLVRILGSTSKASSHALMATIA